MPPLGHSCGFAEAKKLELRSSSLKNLLCGSAVVAVRTDSKPVSTLLIHRCGVAMIVSGDPPSILDRKSDLMRKMLLKETYCISSFLSLLLGLGIEGIRADGSCHGRAGIGGNNGEDESGNVNHCRSWLTRV